MNIYIDCEWNDYLGDLISMALCAESGEEFYQVLSCDNPSEWVRKNVITVLGAAHISMDVFQWKLEQFLLQFDEVTIIADWPEDISRFCMALITGPGTRLNTPPIKMEIHRVDASSLVPHNALHDARGLRQYFLNET